MKRFKIHLFFLFSVIKLVFVSKPRRNLLTTWNIHTARAFMLDVVNKDSFQMFFVNPISVWIFGYRKYVRTAVWQQRDFGPPWSNIFLTEKSAHTFQKWSLVLMKTACQFCFFFSFFYFSQRSFHYLVLIKPRGRWLKPRAESCSWKQLAVLARLARTTKAPPTSYQVKKLIHSNRFHTEKLITPDCYGICAALIPHLRFFFKEIMSIIMAWWKWIFDKVSEPRPQKIKTSKQEKLSKKKKIIWD